MNNVSQTGLDFARECMGWQDARLAKPSDALVLSDSRAVAFDVSDLDLVMAEVCEWCMGRRLTFVLTIEEFLTQDGNPMNVWKCSVGAGRRCLASGANPISIAEAVMSACVLAARRMRKAA